jgi:predicted metal-binding protein
VLLEELQREAAQMSGSRRFRIQAQACLMACESHCNVAMRAEGKICYVVGRMPPDTDSARTLLDYFCQYLESETGRVPYRDWPQGIKGHFVARVPQLQEEG